MIRPDVDQGAVVRHVTELWRDCKNERVAKEVIWDECFRARNSQFGGTWNELQQYRSKRYLPVSNQAVENGKAQLMNGVIPHDEWFNVLGRTPDDDASAKPMTELLKWQHFKTNLESTIAEILDQALTCGNAPWAVVWAADINSVPDQAGHAEVMGKYAADVQSGNIPPDTPVPVAPQAEKVTYDGPVLKTCSIYDYVQERLRRGSSYPSRIVRSHQTKAHLLEWAEPSEFGHAIYENVADIGEVSAEQEASDSLVRGQHAEGGFTDIPKDAVELLEFWGDVILGGVLYKNHVAVVANRKTLIRFEPNPFAHGLPPWNMFGLRPRPNETYADGCLECALDLQDAINVRLNQVIDANNLTINTQFKAINDGTIDPNNFVSAPGIVHLVNDMRNLEPFPVPSEASLGFQELGFLLAQFAEATGVMKAFTTQDYKKTATEVSAVSGMVDGKFAYVVKHVERTLVSQILRMQIKLNQQLMEEAVWVRVVENTQQVPALDPFGQPMPVPMFEPILSRATRLKIAPEDITGEFDIYPVGAQWIANNQAALGALGQLVQTIGGIPPAAEAIRWDKLAGVMFRAARIPESWALIKSQQEIYFDRQQQYQMQLAQQASEAQYAAESKGPGRSGSSSGGKGVQSVAGVPGGGAPPASPGGQPTAGGPQTL